MGCLLLLSASFLVATATSSGPPAHAGPALVPADATVEKLYDKLKFGEGPAWHPDGYLLFEDTQGNRMMKLDDKDEVSVFLEPSGRSNGIAFDKQGRRVAAEGNGDGGRQLSRTGKDGKKETLADRWEGKKLNSPNDVTIDGKGHIFFTDPRYTHRENLELDKEAVYRVDPDGKLSRIIDTLTRPNGIIVTRDGKTLFVADNASPGGVVKLWAFDLDKRGDVKNARVVYDFETGRGIDGMTLDAQGRIWATAGTKEKAGIYVFQLDAKRTTAQVVKFIATPEDPTNCTFGGKARDTLYITSKSSLFRLRTLVKGQPSPPGK